MLVSIIAFTEDAKMLTDMLWLALACMLLAGAAVGWERIRGPTIDQ
jgi:hypothetical protein